LACCQRAPLQPDKYRSEHPLRHALRDQQEELRLSLDMKHRKKSLPRHRMADAGEQQIVGAARAHFFSHGFRSVTMDDLAEELLLARRLFRESEKWLPCCHLLAALHGQRFHSLKRQQRHRCQSPALANRALRCDCSRDRYKALPPDTGLNGIATERTQLVN